MQIFLARNNVQAGPYSLAQLNTMLASKEVLLDDLMWHEGLSNWQRVGDLTGNQRHYSPSTSASSANLPINEDISRQSTSDNQRLTLDKLYGKTTSTNTQTQSSTSKKNKSSAPLSKSRWATAHQSSGTVIKGNPPVTLAPIMSRILALAINGLLYLLAILPLLLALSKLNIDMAKFQSFDNFDAAYQYTINLMQSIPDATIMTSQLMMLGLFAVQLLLIVMRGQSLGKMITGIRVVDQNTHKLPSLGKRLGMRTLVLFIIYNLIFSITSFLGFAVIAVHYFLASKSPQNIGWHDKLAKTLVVKAADDQLNPRRDRKNNTRIKDKRK